MDLIEAIILGVVQGLTEFLPVSSSGHLVLAEHLLKVKFGDISFEVFLHFGTLLSVVIVFRHTIRSMFKAVWLKAKSALSSRTTSPPNEDWRLFWLIILGSVPAGLVGVLFKDYLEKSFSSAVFVSFMLLFTGTVLFVTRFFKAARNKIRWGDAFLVGLGQALAILPGVSRSGLTISTGIFAGVERRKAVEFSFLLSLPAVLGASLLELKDILNHADLFQDLMNYLIGGFTAFVVGYFAIKFLLSVIKKGKFQYFGYYCFAVGLFFLIIVL